MKELEILQQYSTQSYFDYNLLHIAFLDTPINFVLNISFPKKIIQEYIRLTIDLDSILQNTNLKSSVVLHDVSIQLMVYEEDIFLLYRILSLYYKFYNKIQVINIISNDNGFGCPSNLFYEIKLPRESISISFINALKDKAVESFHVEHLDFMDKYYDLIDDYGWEELDKHIKIGLNEIKLLSTQTKSRRLGYAKMILNMF